MPPETKTLGQVAFAAYHGMPFTEFGPPREWAELPELTRARWEAAGEAVAAWPSEATIPIIADDSESLT